MATTLTDARGRTVRRMQSGDLIRYSLVDGELRVTIEHWVGQTAATAAEADALALSTLATALPDQVPAGARRTARVAREAAEAPR